MKKKINYRLGNLITSIIFLISQYAISSNIFLMGDDFMYAVFAKEGIIKSVSQYYQTGNGRWVLNLLDSMVLKYDRYIYSFLLPWLMLLFGVLCYKIVNKICKKENKILYPVTLLLISFLDISITRESIYWITGGINYLVPSILFLGTVNITLKLREENNLNTLKKGCLCIVCVVSCMTMEQFALMSLGFMILMLVWDFYKKNKIEKTRIISALLGVIGLCTILFAPGNMVRISDSSEEGLSLILRILDLFYFNFQSTQAVKYIIIILLCEGVFLYQRKKKCSLVAFVDALVLTISVISSKGLPKMSIVLICVIILLFLSILMYKVIESSEVKCIVFIFVILLSGSQFIVLVAGIIGFRTTFSTTIFYIIMILLLINGILNFSFDLKEKINKGYAIMSVINILVILNLLSTIIGFNKNKEVHLYNVNEAQMKDAEYINIKNYNDEEYGWNSPPLGEFHEKYFRLYYDIADECEIKYLETDGKKRNGDE